MTFMVFKAPGPDKVHGYMVEWKVIDEAKIDEHLASGWFGTAVEAGEDWIKRQSAKAEEAVEDAEEKASVTREEAIQKLEELGVVFDRRLGLTKLLALIEAQLAGPGV